MFTYYFNLKTALLKNISFLLVELEPSKRNTFPKETRIISKPLASFLFSVFFWDRAYFPKCNLSIYFFVISVKCSSCSTIFYLMQYVMCLILMKKKINTAFEIRCFECSFRVLIN